MTFDWQPVWLTLKLASTSTLLLLIIGTPIAWWLARTNAWYKQALSAIVALPLVLPPTVLGFYLLILMAADGPVGALTESLGLGTLPFTFPGLLVASIIYSMPFVVQPLQNAFESLGPRPVEVAATLRASPWDRFLSVVIPLTRPGFLTAAVLAFAHTLGEFGVVTMIGGRVPGETMVLSVAIVEHADNSEYDQAHLLSAGLLAFSFLVLTTLYLVNGRIGRSHQP